MKITSFAEANNFLRRYVPASHHVKYDLTTMQQLMAALGNPQETYKIIHVAGTSGKTSTTYYLASLLHQAGVKVGHTVSPHIDNLGERVQVDLQPLTEAYYCHRLTDFLRIIDKLDIQPSYFELLVAFAFWEFAHQQVDYAVMEVGLGGLLDGTNVISNPLKVGVITDIGFDHMQVLGDTLPKIAKQKAGITQPGNDVFMLRQSRLVVEAITETVTERQGRLHVLQPAESNWPNLVLFQQRNWSLAKQVVDFVLQRDGLCPLSPAQAAASTRLIVPARMETVQYHGKTVILDGSHNGQKIHSLVAAFQAKYPGQQAALMVGLVRDKQAVLEDVLGQLKAIAASLIVTEFHGQQDLPKESLAADQVAAAAIAAGLPNVTIERQPEQALQKLMGKAEKIHVITGSFYLLNHVRPIIFGTNPTRERRP